VIELGENRYGKRAIRLVKVVRGPDGGQVRDLTVDIALEGDFTAAHTAGDNASVVATDTMKNTVYALAAEQLTGAIEEFGTVLARHFLTFPQVQRATVDLREHRWKPIAGADAAAPGAGAAAPGTGAAAPGTGAAALGTGDAASGAFRRVGDATRTARVSATRDGTVVESGLEDLVVMKISGSAFSGFPRDRNTTLAETRDRIMATNVTVTWRHRSPAVEWDASHAAIAATLLEVFADHASESVQHSIWVIARAMLERHAGIDEVTMRLPNLHHLPVDLTPFGGTNRGEIFVATTQPHGLIEATVRRTAS
jgi:urate oxidase